MILLLKLPFICLELILGWIESLVAFFAMAFSVDMSWIWLINIYCRYTGLS